MEEMQTQQPQEQEELQRPRRRRREQPKQKLRIPAFLRDIGQDVRWYYDIRLWSPLLLLILILALVLPGRGKEAADPEVQETAPVVLETEPETEPAPEPIDPEAEALARLADTVGSGRSKNAKIIIMWVAINRSEDHANGYGLTLQEEIARPNQWQFYDENAAYSDASYQLAKEVLAVKRNGDLRPVDSDMLWLVLNDDGSVTVRNKFAVGANQKWTEKTVK